MADSRISKFADILVQHSARVKPGDRVLIEATTAAEPLVRELYIKILEKGGHPVPLLQLPDMFFPGHEDLLIMKGNDAQLDFVPPLQKLAYDNFESRIRIHSSTNTRSQIQDGFFPLTATRQSLRRDHCRADAARRDWHLQMGDHTLSNRSLCPGCRNEFA